MKTRKFILTVILVALVVALINTIVSGIDNTTNNLKYYFIYAAAFTLFNNLYYMFISKILSWHKNPEKTLIISILGSIPVNMLIYFGLNFFFRVIVFHQDFDTFIKNEDTGGYVVIVMFSLIISLLIIIGYFFKKIRTDELHSEQLKTKNEQIKFESLKTQLDPHFLFNNLNVLTALISESPERAENFSIKLSKIYRYVLEQKDSKLVPVQDELKFAEDYLELLKMRFEDNLNYDISINDISDARIPPLSLQILLENATKHNAISKQQKLKIHIWKDTENLIVSNNKNPKKVKQETTKIGLENIKNRYKLLSNQNIKIVDDDNRFIVKLPLL